MSISAAEYLRRVKVVKNLTVLRQLAFDVIIKEESTLRLLKEQDYLEGDIYGTGELVAYRSMAYSQFKENMNPKAHGAVDLILSGDFVEAMFLKKPIGNKYQFGNRDWKRGLLESRYPKGIFGLNQGVFDKFQKEILAPRYIDLLKNTARID